MYRTSTKCTDRDVVAHVEQGQHIQVEEVGGLDKGPAAATAKFLSTSQVEFNQLWEGSQVEL